MTSKRIEDQISSAIEAAAEAAHDTHFSISAETSDMGYAFETESCKRHWRGVAIAVIRALGEAK